MSSAIVPRWEWRAFGISFGTAEERFAALDPERVQESDELYVLSKTVDENVKVRDGLLDVKQLEHVNADGLEQWVPVIKEPFPVAAPTAASVLERLGASAPPSEQDAYTLDELVRELVLQSPELLAVQVHKRRQRYTIGGCTTELTDLRTDVGETRTVAVESEDPGRVIATVRELGLESFPNTSFPRGLKALAGFGEKRYAVIDVGTNSVKFHFAELRADGTWHAVADRAEITRLGEGLAESGRLGAGPIRRTADAIAAMTREAREQGVELIVAVGTAGLRIAQNRQELIDAVRAETDVEIEVISGDEEARLAFLAVRVGLGPVTGALVVFETGGGSSQFTFGRDDQIDEQFSVNVGAARITEQYGLDRAVSEDVVAEAQKGIGAELDRLDGRPTPDQLVGMGGALTNMAAVKLELATYDPEIVQGTLLDTTEIDRQIDVYRTRSADERRGITGLQPNRAEVILAGACIVRTVMSALGSGSLTVSDRGLRHGVLVERFGGRS